jgi:hypothetical protein
MTEKIVIARTPMAIGGRGDLMKQAVMTEKYRSTKYFDIL